MAATKTAGIRYAPEDPSLLKPWRGLIDGKTGFIYFWMTNVTQSQKPVALQSKAASPDESVSVSVSSSVQVQESSSQVPSHENNTIDGDGRNGRDSSGRQNLNSGEISFQEEEYGVTGRLKSWFFSASGRVFGIPERKQIERLVNVKYDFENVTEDELTFQKALTKKWTLGNELYSLQHKGKLQKSLEKYNEVVGYLKGVVLKACISIASYIGESACMMKDRFESIGARKEPDQPNTPHASCGSLQGESSGQVNGLAAVRDGPSAESYCLRHEISVAEEEYGVTSLLSGSTVNLDSLNSENVQYSLWCELQQLCQGRMTLPAYYKKYITLTAKLDSHCLKPRCTCTRCICSINGRLDDHDQALRLKQFLMGLNGKYSAIRQELLGMKPFPSLSKSYELLLKEDQKSLVCECIGGHNKGTCSVLMFNLSHTGSEIVPEVDVIYDIEMYDIENETEDELTFQKALTKLWMLEIELYLLQHKKDKLQKILDKYNEVNGYLIDAAFKAGISFAIYSGESACMMQKRLEAILKSMLYHSELETMSRAKKKQIKQQIDKLKEKRNDFFVCDAVLACVWDEITEMKGLTLEEKEKVKGTVIEKISLEYYFCTKKINLITELQKELEKKIETLEGDFKSDGRRLDIYFMN